MAETSNVDLRHESYTEFKKRLDVVPLRGGTSFAAAWHGEPIAFDTNTSYIPSQRWSNCFGERAPSTE
jgi:hypothetical protein